MKKAVFLSVSSPIRQLAITDIAVGVDYATEFFGVVGFFLINNIHA